MSNLPNWFGRVEGAALFATMLLLYIALGGSWWMFALLLLTIDLSMLGYLAGPRVGAITYNAAHIMIGPLLCIGLGLLSWHWFAVAQFGFIWMAHIGMDKAFGYGLKYPDSFRHTTMGMIGRKKT